VVSLRSDVTSPSGNVTKLQFSLEKRAFSEGKSAVFSKKAKSRAFFFGQTPGVSYTEFIHINEKAKPLTEELTMAKAKKAAKKATTKKASSTTKKAATKKAAPKKAAAAKAPKAKKAATKRKPNPAFMKPLTPSANLAAVVGATPLPRTEVVKKLWAYIKKNDLQDSKNRRNINADDKLKPIFGKAQVTMFEMTKLVSKHLK
jgi:chromatin remodeling complex protein RSC6